MKRTTVRLSVHGNAADLVAVAFAQDGEEYAYLVGHNTDERFLALYNDITALLAARRDELPQVGATITGLQAIRDRKSKASRERP